MTRWAGTPAAADLDESASSASPTVLSKRTRRSSSRENPVDPATGQRVRLSWTRQTGVVRPGDGGRRRACPACGLCGSSKCASGTTGNRAGRAAADRTRDDGVTPPAATARRPARAGLTAQSMHHVCASRAFGIAATSATAKRTPYPASAGSPWLCRRVTAADGDRRSEQNTRSVTRRMTVRMVPAEKFGITNRRLPGPHRVGRRWGWSVARLRSVINPGRWCTTNNRRSVRRRHSAEPAVAPRKVNMSLRRVDAWPSRLEAGSRHGWSSC
jgi:hypothetical protein